MTTLYAIIEADQPMDGEFYTLIDLIKALPFADYDAEIVSFDLAELRADLATSMRIVTEDIVRTWWDNHYGASESLLLIEGGKEAPELAQRFYSAECDGRTQLVEAA